MTREVPRGNQSPRLGPVERQDEPGVRDTAQLAQHGKELERQDEMPRSPPAVPDECIFHIFELAEDAIQKRGDLPSGQVIDALCDEAAVELDDLIGAAVLLIQASDAEPCAELMITAGGQDAAEGDVDMRLDRTPLRWKDVEE